jgi:uncharacterized protein (DUF433 family)
MMGRFDSSSLTVRTHIVGMLSADSGGHRIVSSYDLERVKIRQAIVFFTVQLVPYISWPFCHWLR